MKRLALCLFAVCAIGLATRSVQADWRHPFRADHANRTALRHARGMSWHGPYYHTATGTPVALIVPPTAHMQTNYGWGVSQGGMTPLYHQFYRAYPGEIGFTESPLLPTPNWPSHTSQFGVYSVRGPW